MKSLRQKMLCLVLVALFSSIVCANVTYNFECITNNSAYNAACGETQLTFDIKDMGNSQAVITFLNSGAGNSGVIEEVFFEDISGLLSFSSFEPFESDVKFKKVKGDKLNLPGGNEKGVDFMESYGFYATPPAPKHGVELGESLGLVFGYSCDFQALVDSIGNGQLRIGLHVISFCDDGSESFVSCCPPPPSVPVPSAFILAFIGIATVLKAKKKFD